MPSATDNPVDEVVEVEPPSEADTLNFAIAFMLKCIDQILNVLEPIDIKSQGSEFPFQTHPRSTNLAVTSLLLWFGFHSRTYHFCNPSWSRFSLCNHCSFGKDMLSVHFVKSIG
ncbi:unnamed protein product [Lactuca saligna]|uniref:Uncharacterized protein n=1 Tax=Lactuca saligna TaxID=75948 RepID=A0AA36EDB3_LACSI|nr:unnamed protein product [Lactuca saligna]